MKIKKIILGLAAIVVLTNSANARSLNVRRQSSEKMTYNDSGVYQETYYDYGSLLPGDDAKITAVSRGSYRNYASIKYSDEGMGYFMREYNKNKNSTSRKYSYTSVYDVLDAGSYAYSTGAVELDLNVVK